MWESVLWLTVIGLIQIVALFVMVLLVRVAIRDHRRELARMAPSGAMSAISAAPTPEEPQLARSNIA